MINDKTVGIIIAIYNVEKYLKRCIDSAINQTYKNLEIILVNNGSTDSSLNIAKHYALLDSRITLIDKKGQESSSTKNVGIDYLKNTYETLLDVEHKRERERERGENSYRL